jgi:hypothetical protein
MNARKSRKKSDCTTKSDYPLVPENLVLMPKHYFDWTVELDLHGTIVDWLTPFVQYASQSLKRDVQPESFRVYFPGYDARSGFNNAEFNALFYEFVRRGDYGRLKPYEGAVDALRQLAEAGFQLRISTWTPGPFELSPHHGRSFGTGRAQQATMQLIKDLKLPVADEDLQFVHGRDKPRTMLEYAIKVPLLFEDSPSTAVSAVSEYGIACFLIDQPYNRSLLCHGITRFSSLAESVPSVFEFFDQLEKAGVMNPRPDISKETSHA